MKYWLWTSEEENFDFYGIFEYDIVPFDEDVPFEEARIKKILFSNCKHMEVGDTYELFHNAITSNPQRILKFLFVREF